MILNPLSNVFTMIDSDDCETTDGHDTFWKEAEERYGKKFVDMYTSCDDIIEQMKELSMFNLDLLDEDLLTIYGMLVKYWMAISPIIDNFFLGQELSVINNLIQQSLSTEIYSDLERLVYLIYDFSPSKLFTPESYNFQELTVLKNQLSTN